MIVLHATPIQGYAKCEFVILIKYKQVFNNTSMNCKLLKTVSSTLKVYTIVVQERKSKLKNIYNFDRSYIIIAYRLITFQFCSSFY